MKGQPSFRPYRPGRHLLLPQRLDQWLPEDHPACFAGDVVNSPDLSRIHADCDSGAGGQPAHEPKTMVCLPLCACCAGVPGSRLIERPTSESAPSRAPAADQHPDRDTIASFRERRLEAPAGLFVQTLEPRGKADLVKPERAGMTAHVDAESGLGL